MGMAVEMPGAFQDSGPGPAWVVTEKNSLALVGDFQLLRRRLVPLKGRDDRMDPVLSLVVMIAKDQDLPAHEPRENASYAITVVEAHGKIPEVIDDVIWVHDGVPAPDHKFIHVANVGEGTAAGRRRQHKLM